MSENQHSFLDVETTLVSWLGELLSVPVYLEAPEEMPERFITVERVGGSSSNMVVDRPTVAIQTWAPTRIAAGLLANDVASAVALMPKEIQRITRATVSSYENYPLKQDETTIPRYQVTIDLVTR